MDKKKVLVLGVGNAQVDFIKFCKSKNYEVHSCSYKNEGRGIELSDYFSVINIIDSKNVEDYVLKNKIDIVYSTGSDLAMPTLTRVSQKLKLPCFISAETALTCNDKTKLRGILKIHPEYNVSSQKIKKESDLKRWNTYPAIIKPADSQGQRGIQELSDEKSLVDSFNNAIKHSITDTVIIEEYIDGFEISINLYVVNGNIKFDFISERISFDEYPGGIIKRHLYPVKKYYDKGRVMDMCNKLIKTLKINDGPAYLQVKIDNKGNPKLIEITPRLDGCHMWRLIKEIKRVSLFEILISHLSNKKINDDVFYQKNDNNVSGELLFFTSAANQKFKIQNYTLSKNMVYYEWYYEENELIKAINGYADKVGYQITINHE